MKPLYHCFICTLVKFVLSTRKSISSLESFLLPPPPMLPSFALLAARGMLSLSAVVQRGGSVSLSPCVRHSAHLISSETTGKIKIYDIADTANGNNLQGKVITYCSTVASKHFALLLLVFISL